MSLTEDDKQWIAGHLEAVEQRAVEAMRTMQTEILRGIEAFARGNFARMVRLETGCDYYRASCRH